MRNGKEKMELTNQKKRELESSINLIFLMTLVSSKNNNNNTILPEKTPDKKKAKLKNNKTATVRYYKA